jgi:hypothetical protein
LDSLLNKAVARQKQDNEDLASAADRAARLHEQKSVRARLELVFDQAHSFPREANKQGHKPCVEGFQRWAQLFIDLGTVMRQCDDTIAELRLVERLEAVSRHQSPDAMKYACALLVLASEGQIDAVKPALEKANNDGQLRRFVLWLPFILDHLWYPIRDGNRPTSVAESPEGTSQEESDQAEKAFGWRPIALESVSQAGETAPSGNGDQNAEQRRKESQAPLAQPAAEGTNGEPAPDPAALCPECGIPFKVTLPKQLTRRPRDDRSCPNCGLSEDQETERQDQDRPGGPHPYFDIYQYAGDNPGYLDDNPERFPYWPTIRRCATRLFGDNHFGPETFISLNLWLHEVYGVNTDICAIPQAQVAERLRRKVEGGDVTPVVQEAALPPPAHGAADGAKLDALLNSLPRLISAPDLAEKLGENEPKVESFLRRLRSELTDCFIDASKEGGRRVNEPKYMYRTADIAPELRKIIPKWRAEKRRTSDGRGK